MPFDLLGEVTARGWTETRIQPNPVPCTGGCKEGNRSLVRLGTRYQASRRLVNATSMPNLRCLDGTISISNTSHLSALCCGQPYFPNCRGWSLSLRCRAYRLFGFATGSCGIIARPGMLPAPRCRGSDCQARTSVKNQVASIQEPRRKPTATFRRNTSPRQGFIPRCRKKRRSSATHPLASCPPPIYNGRLRTSRRIVSSSRNARFRIELVPHLPAEGPTSAAAGATSHRGKPWGLTESAT